MEKENLMTHSDRICFSGNAGQVLQHLHETQSQLDVSRSRDS
jgi:hypothetical protein